MASKMWEDIGQAYNLVTSAGVTSIEGEATGCDWRVAKVSGNVVITIRKVTQ